MSQQCLWLGNCLVLDFVNTEVLHNGPIEELLQTPTDFLQWIADAGLVSVAKIPFMARALGADLRRSLDLARDYRGRIRKSLGTGGFRQPLPSVLLKMTNDLLSNPTKVTRLAIGGRRKSVLTSQWKFTSGEDLLRPIAQSLAEVIGTQEARRIRRCRNPACILYFYDRSKGNTRVWCSAAMCGNKMRVAAFRRGQSRMASKTKGSATRAWKHSRTSRSHLR